jgi:hypothetical protein
MDAYLEAAGIGEDLTLLKEVDRLWSAKKGSAKGDKLEALLILG